MLKDLYRPTDDDDQTSPRRALPWSDFGGVTSEEISRVKLDPMTLFVVRLYQAIAANPEGKPDNLVQKARLTLAGIADFLRDVQFLNTDRITEEQKATTVKSYNANSLFYSAIYEFEPEMILRTRADYLKLFKEKLGAPNGNRRVLVLGSGAGRDVDDLVRAGFMVVAVDASESMFDATEALFADGETTNYNLSIAEASEKLFAISRNHFKGILAESVLEHLNKDEVFDLIPRFRYMIAPDGVILIRLKLTETGAAYRVVDGVGERYFTSWTMDQIQQLKKYMEENNFEIVEVEKPLASHIDAENDKDRDGVNLKPPFYTIMAKWRPKL